MGKIILSGFADEYSSNFNEQIEVLTANNFPMVELRFVDGENIVDLTNDKLEIVKNKLSANGLKVSSIGSPLGKINLKDDFKAHLEKTKRAIEIANYLQTNRIRVFSFYLPENATLDECRNQVIDNLGKMIDLANDGKVNLCLENEANVYGESPERALDVLNNFNGKLKCVFDMGNFVLDGYKPYPDAYNMLEKYIEYFHIKDALSQGAIVPAGKGEGEIENILRAYKQKVDKDFIITLEPHLQTFSGFNALTNKTFDNPYKYPDQKVAFLDAIKCLKEICSKI